MTSGPPPPPRPPRVTPHAPTRLQRCAAWIVYASLRSDAATQRFRVVDPHGSRALAARSAVVFVIWHNRLAFSLIIHRRFIQPLSGGRRLAAMVSASRDGALLSAVLEAFDVEPVRGSSSRRGAQALVELRSWAERGLDLAITPDGPRGPCYQAQAGVLAIARATRRPLIPVACNTTWKLRLRSWDRFQIPLPFGRPEVAFGRAIQPPADGSPSAIADAQARLQAELDAITKDQGD